MQGQRNISDQVVYDFDDISLDPGEGQCQMLLDDGSWECEAACRH